MASAVWMAHGLEQFVESCRRPRRSGPRSRSSRTGSSSIAPPQRPQLLDGGVGRSGVHPEGRSASFGARSVVVARRRYHPPPVTIRVGFLGAGFIARYHAMQLTLADGAQPRSWRCTTRTPARADGVRRRQGGTRGGTRRGGARRVRRRVRLHLDLGAPRGGAAGGGAGAAGVLREAAVDRPGRRPRSWCEVVEAAGRA